MAKGACIHDGCDSPAWSRGRCNRHYRIDRASGALPKLNDMTRFMDKVAKGDGCWTWVGGFRTDGYGIFRFRGKVWAAHRASWELLRGPIPEGMFLDHVCHNKACVNPDHLRPATCRQNNEYRSGPQSNSTTGVRGVFYDKSRNKYAASVLRDRKPLFFKRFDTLEEAEAAVKEARARYFHFPEAA